MAQTSAPEGGPAADTRYAGYSRFELELEFVQCLANPLYLNHLATQKLFEDPCFVAYLDYLQYFSKPEYISFLTYPGPTLKALQLLQLEQFRKDILNPLMVETLIQQWVVANCTSISIIIAQTSFLWPWRSLELPKNQSIKQISSDYVACYIRPRETPFWEVSQCVPTMAEYDALRI